MGAMGVSVRDRDIGVRLGEMRCKYYQYAYKTMTGPAICSQGIPQEPRNISSGSECTFDMRGTVHHASARRRNPSMNLRPI